MYGTRFDLGPFSLEPGLDNTWQARPIFEPGLDYPSPGQTRRIDRPVLLIYVDDAIVTGSDMHRISTLLQVLGIKFSIKDLGSLHFFLGIEIVCQNFGSLLPQSKYICDLLIKTKTDGAKLMTSLMATSNYFSRFFAPSSPTQFYIPVQWVPCNILPLPGQTSHTPSTKYHDLCSLRLMKTGLL